MARNRGAQSLITTFEDESYRAPFSGNVIELCPVGALTSTQYRFEARPWEIQNVPTVCGLCPVGCNISRDDARGQGQADPLAQPPRGRPGLALRQGSLRLPAPLRGRPDRRPARARAPARLRRALLGRRARPRRGAAARRAGPDRHGALRLGDARAGLRARQAAAPGARRALGRAGGGDLVRARRLPGAALGDRGRRDRRRRRRRGGRGPRPDRRALDQAGAPQRRRGRPASPSRSSARSSSSASPPPTARS